MNFGKHLILDCASCNMSLIKDKENISTFVSNLLLDIKMVPLAPLWIEWCDTNDPLKQGISYVQVLQDSHTSAHFVDVNGDSYFDCFSCLDFDENIVIDLFKKYFEPKSVKATIVNRQA